MEALQSPDEVSNMRSFSSRSFDVGGSGWTKGQTQKANQSLKSYREGQARKSQMYADRKQWERYRLAMGEDAPKTFSAFRRIKNNNGERWNEVKADYRSDIAEIRKMPS